MARWNRIAAAAWLALIPALVGCHKENSAVAVIPRTTATLLWEPMHMGAAETARVSGLHIYWNAPADEGDTEKQLAVFRSAQRRGFRGIIFAPDETLASRSSVLEVVNDRVPVVIVDDDLGPPSGPFLSYVSNDEVAGARLAADRVAKILDGRGSIAVLGISPRLESGISREEDFARALAVVAPGIQIKIRRFGDSVITHQQQIAQEVLSGEEPISAIVALTAAATRGAYYAKIAAHPPSRVPIVGFDQDLLLPIQTGDIDSVVVQNTRKIGQVAIENLEVELRGGTVETRTLVPPLLLTRETMHSAPMQSLWAFTTYPWSTQ